MKPKHLIIIGFGPVANYKYCRCIFRQIEKGYIHSYSVVDLQSQKNAILQRLKKMPIKPFKVFFLADDNPNSGYRKNVKEFDDICKKLSKEMDLKVVIATEARAHKPYLEYCVKNNIDSLVTKPITTPVHNGVFAPKELSKELKKLIDLSKNTSANHAVICLGRYHEIYEKNVRETIQQKMNILKAPITSIHLKTASGVWNMFSEYETREDHPYKYGYGMLMHGAYHYIDIFMNLLRMNKSIYPNHKLSLYISTYSAAPKDQSIRIPNTLNQLLTGYKNKSTKLPRKNYGETDIVANICLKDETTKQVLTLGTLALEQTTPGFRHWQNFPKVPYNINGRLHSTELDVRLSTVFSISGNVVKIPISARNSVTDLRGRNFGRIITRSNAVLLGDQEFYHEKEIHREYGNSFSFTAELQIFDEWLQGRETKSSLASHLPSVILLQKLAESISKPGKEIKIPFDFETYETKLDI